MGYFSCNADSAIATCDPYNWDRKRRKNNKKTTKPIQIRHFTYADLLTATNYFSAESFLGKGSHGTVYRAILDGGKLIAAVKKTTHHHQPAFNSCSPADNEIEVLSRVQHPRLVNLIGFSDTDSNKLLVVEYMPNGSLYDLLHSTTTCTSRPGWTRRVRFALQIAKAVQALHSSNPPVIHRDIKSSNVLIDESWNARLGDFGLALRGRVEDMRVKSTPPAGTLGYLDPAYLAPADLSNKSDVFSFGILLLEIISGRNAIDVNYSPPSIVDWAVPMIKRGHFAGICDHRLGPPVDPTVVRNLAVLAAKCVRTTVEKRPSMAEVVEGLKFVRKRLHAPIWNHLRRRVSSVQESHGLDVEEETVGVTKAVKVGNRRNRKVSNVSSLAYGSEPVGSVAERMTRSKSVGSLGRRSKAGLAVKMPAVVKLSKSRSTGLLYSPQLVHYKGKGLVLEIGIGRDADSQTRQNDGQTLPRLFLGLDLESEKEMHEKTLRRK